MEIISLMNAKRKERMVILLFSYWFVAINNNIRIENEEARASSYGSGYWKRIQKSDLNEWSLRKAAGETLS